MEGFWSHQRSEKHDKESLNLPEKTVHSRNWDSKDSADEEEGETCVWKLEGRVVLDMWGQKVK